MPSTVGGQPFDILAMKDCTIYSIDCKYCSSSRFSFSRIEENQKNAFAVFNKRVHARSGFMLKYKSDGQVFFLPYSKAIALMQKMKTCSRATIEKNSIKINMEDNNGDTYF